MLSSQRDRGPSVALSIPTWEACKWRGRAVIIYSLQFLTLDSELITAKGKSDWTWRVPEPVTLISVRCLQQEVRGRQAWICTHVYMFVCLCATTRWRVGDMVEWLNHDSKCHVVRLFRDNDTEKNIGGENNITARLLKPQLINGVKLVSNIQPINKLSFHTYSTLQSYSHHLNLFHILSRYNHKSQYWDFMC